MRQICCEFNKNNPIRGISVTLCFQTSPMQAGLYIHIPFCKQACHYCDFHFSTSLKNKKALLEALVQEMVLRQATWQDAVFDTLYFGGGTPSLLSKGELEKIMHTAFSLFKFVVQPEITLEANPDDLNTPERFESLKSLGINRLSIGIQSFCEKDLRLMNRAHNHQQALDCLENGRKFFNNISIDLIYGIPEMQLGDWQENLEVFKQFELAHLSAYALTVEPRTALQKFIDKGLVAPVDEEKARRHFEFLLDFCETHQYVHYETSNFGREGYFSRNNTAYWTGHPYLGIGPAAHSFNGGQRSWNVANNSLYIKDIQQKKLPSQSETLSVYDRYNETVMTGLRTVWGISFSKVEEDFGMRFKDFLQIQAQEGIRNGWLIIEDNTLKTTRSGKFLADGLAADLFMLAPEKYLADES